MNMQNENAYIGVIESKSLVSVRRYSEISIAIIHSKVSLIL